MTEHYMLGRIKVITAWFVSLCKWYVQKREHYQFYSSIPVFL